MRPRGVLATGLVLATAVLCFAGPGPGVREAPIARATTPRSLAGTWRYSIARDAGPGRIPADAGTMPVPSNWYTEGLDRSGVVWFYAAVDLPVAAGWRLGFTGVDYQCDVYWDGDRVGGHVGYFAPFTVDVPSRQGRHLLAVRVDSPRERSRAWSLHKTLIKGVLAHHDTRPGGAWSLDGQDANTGGIWGDVVAIPATTAWIDVLGVTTERVAAGSDAELRIRATVTPLGNRAVDVGWRLVSPTGTTAASGRWRGTGALDIPVVVHHASAWWPRDLGRADLYRVELDVDGVHLARRFGIRTVVQDARGRILVNGVPVFLRGTNYIGSMYLASLGTGAVERDVGLMVAANINAVRVHAHVTSPAFYAAADAAGLLVWQDFPLQWGYDDSPEFAAEAARQLGDMLADLGTHPSIIHWTAQNEAPWSADWMVWKYPDYDPDQNRLLSRALDAVLAMDPTRPSQANSGTAEHVWLGWYSGTDRDFDKPQTAPVITEYGAQALPSRATLATILRPDQLWPVEANLAAWQYHGFQYHELVDIAKVPLGHSVDELIANTQAYQAELVQRAAEGLRRQAWQPIAGIFQFMFVEHWPSMNWGVVDYLRRPKPGYDALRIAYQPVLAMAARCRPGQLRIYVANDLAVGADATVVAARGRGGTETASRTLAVAIEPTSLVIVDDAIEAPGSDETLTLAVVGRDGTTISENHYAPGYFTN